MTLLLAMPGAVEMARQVAARLGCACACVDVHTFPDGEHRVRIGETVAQRTVVLVAALDAPDTRLLPLVFAADLARELGAARVGLVAPYLPYMRQDHRFRTGEAISSRSFARLLSPRLDFLVTVEPHLHRWHSLGDIFETRARAVSAARPIAAWIRDHVPDPVPIGPDAESEQWVARIAAELGTPFAVLNKVRHGDRDVEIALPAQGIPAGTPLLVDDIVSTGATILAAADALRAAGRAAAHCLCVHALASDDAAQALERAGIRLVSCDSVTHPSNAIPLATVLAECLREPESP